jgi:DNA-binding SARP family transcriptional activator
MNHTRTVHLRLFGSPSVVGEDGVRVTGPAVQRHRLALLALLALAPGRVLSRERLTAYLWPERRGESARQLLNQAVYHLRNVLGDRAVLSEGDDLRLDPQRIRIDVADFDAAVVGGNHEEAVGLYPAPLLDGFFLSDAPEFERWVEREREHRAGAHARTLEALAAAAEEVGDTRAAVTWWKARAGVDPYDSRVAIRLVGALEASGNRAGAIQHAAHHQRLLQEEFGAEPDPAVLALAERLRTEPAPASDPDPRPGPAATGPAAATNSADASAAPASTARPSQASPSHAPRRLRLTVQVAAAALVLGAAAVGAFRLVLGPDGPARGASHDAVLPVTDPSGGVERDSSSGAMIEDDIARSIARELRGRLGGAGRALRRPPTGNVAAYEFYLRGSDLTRLRSDSAAWEGLEQFRQAIALDSAYAAAWAGLGLMYGRVAHLTPVPARARYWTLAREATGTAIALDPSLPEAHATLGMIRMRSFDPAGAEPHLRRAIELDPGRALSYEWMVTFQLWTGHPAEALAYALRALDLDPLSAIGHAEVAHALLHTDRCPEALLHLEALAGMHPPLLRAAPLAALCHVRTGMLSEAVAVLRPQAERGEPHALSLLGWVLAGAGQAEEALPISDDLTARWGRGEANAFQVAMVHAGLGDLDQAFLWLDRGLDEHASSGVPGLTLNLLLMGPLLDRLRDDPRFAQRRERMALRLP